MPAYARNPFFSDGYIAFQGDGDFFAATSLLASHHFFSGSAARRDRQASNGPGNRGLLARLDFNLHSGPAARHGPMAPQTSRPPGRRGQFHPLSAPNLPGFNQLQLPVRRPYLMRPDPDFPASKTEAGSRPHKARHSPNSAIYPPRILASHPRTRLKRRH